MGYQGREAPGATAKERSKTCPMGRLGAARAGAPRAARRGALPGRSSEPIRNTEAASTEGQSGGPAQPPQVDVGRQSQGPIRSAPGSEARPRAPKGEAAVGGRARRRRSPWQRTEAERGSEVPRGIE